MIQLLKYLGLFTNGVAPNSFNYKSEDYKLKKGKKILLHKALLTKLEISEEERLQAIENKSSQIVTYTGIIFSALSLFVPIMLDGIVTQPFSIRIIFILFLVITFLLYILTIHNALKNYNIGNFFYSRPDPNNVIKYQEKTSKEFEAIGVQDLLDSYRINFKTNNQRANNLIYAYRSFRLANIFTAIMAVMISLSLLFAIDQNDGQLRKQVIIQNFESLKTDTTTEIRQLDTISSSPTIQAVRP